MKQLPKSAHLSKKFARLPPTARNLALKALLLVDGGQTIQQALQAVLESPAVQDAEQRNDREKTFSERNLCTELAYGCLRYEIRIAYILHQVLPKAEGLPHAMLHILAMAAYGLLFQKKIPDYACIHEAVQTVRTLYGQRLAAVANGCLRTVQRQGDAPLTQAFYTKNNEMADCLFYSLPQWVMTLWQKAYGEEAATLLAGRSLRRPWAALRVNARGENTAKLREAVQSAGQAVGQWGAAFAPGELPRQLLGKTLRQWEKDGKLSFQAAGSQLILEQLGVYAWDAPIWDACAGFGGKTTALLERGRNVTLATDTALHRLHSLPGQCRRLQLPTPHTILADAKRPPLKAWEGNILLDAPCSGLGVLARRPDLRRRPKENYTRIQRALLLRAAELIQPGFRIAYITCTLDPAENEAVIKAVLAANKNLRQEEEWQTSHTHPWLEGMYGAVLRCL